MLTAQRIRREGRSFYVPSRTRPGMEHRVDWAMDGALFCNCESTRKRDNECWAVKAVREEIEMTGLKESTALVPVSVVQSAALVPTDREISAIKAAAQMAFEGKIALPEELKTEAQVRAVMMYGWDLGLKPMTALRHLYIVKGKVQPSAEVMAGLVLSRYPDARLYVEEINDARCTMRLRWPSRQVNHTYTVTWQDIERAGLAAGANKQYPQDRMRYHATKRLLRIYAPDVINGLDQGAPYFGEGPAAPEDAIDSDDLYNAGDGSPVQYIDGQVVEKATGEITHGDPQAAADEPSAPTAPPSAPASPSAAPPDKMPANHPAYVEHVLQLLEKEGHDRDTVTDAAQQKYGNKEPRSLTAPEMRDLAAEFAVKVALPGQPTLGV